MQSIKRVAQNAAAGDSVSSRLFIHIDDSALKKLVEQMSLINVAPSETVYERGDKGMLLFIVGSGTFEVSGDDSVSEIQGKKEGNEGGGLPLSMLNSNVSGSGSSGNVSGSCHGTHP